MSQLRRLGLTAALLALVGAAGWQLLADREPVDAPPLATSPQTDAATPTVTRAASGSDAAAAEAKRLDAQLAEWRHLHRPIGQLSQAETEALIAQREALAEALAAAIGSLSDFDSVLERYEDAAVRDQLVFIDGLGRSGDPAAVDALEQLYDENEGYTERSHILRSLGDSPADGHTDLLLSEMTGADDERLQQLAAQGLYGEASAVDALAAVAADTSQPMNTRLEAIHSMGTADGADDALAALANSDELEARVTQFAQKTIERG